MKLGGGNNKDFLLSLHRLDQPCSGVILFAKTSKAATRVTTLWKKKKVEKEYLCVVSADRIERLLAKTVNLSQQTSEPWYSLCGTIQSTKESARSVVVRSIGSQSNEADEKRKISLRFCVMDSVNINPNYRILCVRTNQGSRHMVRATLAQVGECPIEGDLRYGSVNQKPLKDQSVALHASRLLLDTSLKLGNLDTFEFQAPIPCTWNEYFGIVP